MSDPQLHLLLSRVTELTARAGAAEAAIQRVRERHWPKGDAFDDRLYTCGHCGWDWPCDTIRALDGGDSGA